MIEYESRYDKSGLNPTPLTKAELRAIGKEIGFFHSTQPYICTQCFSKVKAKEAHHHRAKKEKKVRGKQH